MTTPLPGNVTPLGVASLAITAVFAPLVAWLTRNAAKLLKKYNVLSSKYSDLRKEVDTLKTSCEVTDRRLIKVEEALVEIRAAGVRSESQLTAISGKLDALPRMDTLIQAQASLIAKIVPREEVERTLSQYDHRLRLVEQDIRKQ